MGDAARRGFLRRAYRVIVASRVAAYVLIALSGVASLVWPPPAIVEASQQFQPILYGWSVLMVAAGVFCAYGAAAGHWVGEYIGLIPLGAVALAYGISALARGSVGWAGGLFLLGFFMVLVSRWQEVALLRVEAVKTKHGETAHDDHA
jgi:hypothetical protein